MLDSSLLSALRVLHARLDKQPINWAITASCSLALQGVPVSVRDVDLATDRAGAYRLEQRFANEREFGLSNGRNKKRVQVQGRLLLLK